MGNTKTQAQQASTKAATGLTTDKIKPAPEQHNSPARAQRAASPMSPPKGSPSPARAGGIVSVHEKLPQASKRAQMSVAIQRQLGNIRVASLMGGPQAEIPVGEPGDRYEQQADEVASRVVSGQKVARISRIAAGVVSSMVSRQELEEEAPQMSPLQRQAPEEKELLQGQAERKSVEEEEETPIQTVRVQQQPEEEELLQGQAPGEEEKLQGQTEEKSAEEREEIATQTAGIRRQPEEEERLQAQAEEEPEEEETVRRVPLRRRRQRKKTPVSRVMGLQRQEEAEEEPWPEPTEGEMEAAKGVQAKAEPGGAAAMEDAGAEARIKSPGGGRPLPEGIRTDMETGLGADFSGVRVHDTASDQADAGRLNAKAFAYRNHIWLGKGASASDHKLMAHELTHVVQQGAAVQKAPVDENQKPKPTHPGPATEATQPISRAREKVQRVGGILGKVAGFARQIPGYHLLSVIIGRDPISGEAVPRTAANVIKGVIGLIPGGNILYENLNKTGAIDKAGAWLDKQVRKLGFTWQYIKGLFSEAWDALSVWDLALPWRAFSKIKRVFTQPIQRLIAFAKSIGSKILEFIFEGAMALAGGFGKKVLGYLKKAGAFFLQIIKDPVGFIGNLVKALGQGFRQFSANIWTHLKAGLLGWLFGALAGSGLQLPDKLDLKGILSLVMQILGITYQAIRKRIVKVIGEKRMARVEKTVTFVADLLTRGPIAAWEMITSAIGNLTDMVLSAIQNWVVTKIVKSAILKLVSMFNPAGAIVQAAMAIYNTVMFFIERAQQIAELVNSIFNSIAKIASGAVGAAAKFIEQTMARTLPVIISFLARLIGLGGIGEKIRGIIKKIQKPIAKGVDKVVKFVVGKVKKLFGKGGVKKEGAPKKSKDHDNKVAAGLADIDKEEKRYLESGKISQKNAEKVAVTVQKRHPIFKSISVKDAKDTWDYEYVASNGKKKGEAKLEGDRNQRKDKFGVTLSEIDRRFRHRIGKEYDFVLTADLWTIRRGRGKAKGPGAVAQYQLVHKGEGSYGLEEVQSTEEAEAKGAHDRVMAKMGAVKQAYLKGHGKYAIGHPGTSFSIATRDLVDDIGYKTGDHSDPSIKTPGTAGIDPKTASGKKGLPNWVPDHQPPDILLSGGASVSFRFYPHSNQSRVKQGGIVRIYKLWMKQERGAGDSDWAKGVKSEWFW